MPQWTITDKEIQALWTEIWPKIVAIAWMDDHTGLQGAAGSYRKCFEGDAQFRQCEVQRIARILRDQGMLRLSWTADIPICITDPMNLGIIMSQYAQQAEQCLGPRSTTLPDNTDTGRGFQWSCPATLYGETFFYINHKGILLPWPAQPSLQAIFIGYAEGGGVLPRTELHNGPPNWAGSTLVPPESDLYDMLIDFTLPEGGCDGAVPWCDPVGLSGIALLTLFEKWGEVVGGAWTYPGVAPDDIRANLQDYIKPEVWSHWPSYLQVGYTTEHVFRIVGDSDNGETDNYIQMTAPVPAPQDIRLPTLTEVFQELIVGHATNPMYSNCY